MADENEKEKLEIEVLRLQHKQLMSDTKPQSPIARFLKSSGPPLLVGVLALYVQHIGTQIRLDRMERDAAAKIQLAEDRAKEADVRVHNAGLVVRQAGAATAGLRAEYESIEARADQARAATSIEQGKLQAALKGVRDAEAKLTAVQRQFKPALVSIPNVVSGRAVSVALLGCPIVVGGAILSEC